MTEGDRVFEKTFPGKKALDIFPMDGKATECPRCALEFKSMLHPFCNNHFCPAREYGQSQRGG